MAMSGERRKQRTQRSGPCAKLTSSPVLGRHQAPRLQLEPHLGRVQRDGGRLCQACSCSRADELEVEGQRLGARGGRHCVLLIKVTEAFLPCEGQEMCSRRECPFAG